MSSNHAGETGAVHIYQGALRGLELRDKLRKLGLPIGHEGVKQCVAFCHSHKSAESIHLAFLED
eukprot:scaffold352268_cov45-Prasinocladus_malaysianus.AAC.1